MNTTEALELLKSYEDWKDQHEADTIDDIHGTFLDEYFNNSAPNKTRIISENEGEESNCLHCGCLLLDEQGENLCEDCKQLD